MKKLVPAIVALVVGLLVALVFLWREKPHRPQAGDLAPADALVFAHLPDIRRTMQRWPGTAIAQLWNDPEMRAFMAQPLEKMPLLLRAQEHLERLHRIGPREAFVAILSVDGPTPKFVAGLRFSGSKSDVATLVAEPWAEWRKTWPAGRAELLHRDRWEIETYTFEDKVLAGSFHAGWYFVANDVAALEQTLARCEASAGSGIASTPALQQAAGPLPLELDAFVFAQSGLLLGRMSAALTGKAKPAEAEKHSDSGSAMSWGAKLEGARIRDTIFITGAPATEAPLTRTTQPLTSPESLLYGGLIMPARLDLPPSTSPLLTLLMASPALALSRKAVSWADFTAAFGPECGLVLDWPTAADAPAVSFIFTVRDSALAARLVESLAGSGSSGTPWEREEAGAVTHYRAPVDRKVGTTPALAVTPQFVVLGAQSTAVRAVVSRLNTGSPDIGSTPTFHEIASTVGAPTIAFAYLDLHSLLERSYETLRPFLGMSLALSPETGPYFDTAKLPSAAAIGRHLGPSVYSQSAKAGGIFVESVGSVSFSQTLAGFAAFAWSSAAPAVRRLGSRENRPAVSLPIPPVPPIANAPENFGKPAETSGGPENPAEKSHIRASQP